MERAGPVIVPVRSLLATKSRLRLSSRGAKSPWPVHRKFRPDPEPLIVLARRVRKVVVLAEGGACRAQREVDACGAEALAVDACRVDVAAGERTKCLLLRCKGDLERFRLRVGELVALCRPVRDEGEWEGQRPLPPFAPKWLRAGMDE